MKKSLSKVVLATMLATVPLAADNYSYDTYSLFAIEGGMTQLDIETTGAPTIEVHEKDMGHVGLKIGAQGNDFRAFLSARYYAADSSEELSTVGGELQYLFNFSNAANFFIGGNTGLAFVKVGATDLLNSESIQTSYYGADAGFNIHAGEKIDIEIGAKYMALDDEITQGAYTHKLDSIISAYASVVFKWQMN